MKTHHSFLLMHLEHVSYTIVEINGERGTTPFCYISHAVPDTINVIGFYNNDPGADYPPPLLGLTGHIHNSSITETTRVVCYTQSIYEDEKVEQDEFFSLILIIQSNSAELIGKESDFSRTLFRIIDNDDSGSIPPGMISAIVVCTIRYVIPSIFLYFLCGERSAVQEMLNTIVWERKPVYLCTMTFPS